MSGSASKKLKSGPGAAIEPVNEWQIVPGPTDDFPALSVGLIVSRVHDVETKAFFEQHFPDEYCRVAHPDLAETWTYVVAERNYDRVIQRMRADRSFAWACARPLYPIWRNIVRMQDSTSIFESLSPEELKRRWATWLPPTLVEQLKPWQKSAVEYFWYKKGCALLADDMGLGKTLSVTTFLMAYDRQRHGARNPNFPVLIVTPVAPRKQWVTECFAFFPDTPKSAIVILKTGDLVRHHLALSTPCTHPYHDHHTERSPPSPPPPPPTKKRTPKPASSRARRAPATPILRLADVNGAVTDETDPQGPTPTPSPAPISMVPPGRANAEYYMSKRVDQLQQDISGYKAAELQMKEWEPAARANYYAAASAQDHMAQHSSHHARGSTSIDHGPSGPTPSLAPSSAPYRKRKGPAVDDDDDDAAASARPTKRRKTNETKTERKRKPAATTTTTTDEKKSKPVRSRKPAAATDEKKSKPTRKRKSAAAETAVDATDEKKAKPARKRKPAAAAATKDGDEREEKAAAPQIYIMSYGLLSDDELLPYLTGFPWATVVMDEGHNISTRTSKCGKNATILMRKVKQRIIISGTPGTQAERYFRYFGIILPSFFPTFFVPFSGPGPSGAWVENRARLAAYIPDEKHATYGERYTAPYTQRLQGANRVYKHERSWRVPEAALTIDHFMVLRRTKPQVAPGLPPKHRFCVSFQLGERDRLLAAEDVLKRQQYEERGDERGRQNHLMDVFNNRLPAIKRPIINRYIRRMFTSGENALQRNVLPLVFLYALPCLRVAAIVASYLPEPKALLFAHHHESLKSLDALLTSIGVNHVLIYGAITVDKRTPMIEAIQNDLNVRAAVLGITALNAGVNLQAAKKAIVTELTWKPETHIQAEDRIHRMNSTEAVSVEYPILQGSLDNVVFDSICNKQAVANRLLDTLAYRSRYSVSTLSVAALYAPDEDGAPAAIPMHASPLEQTAAAQKALTTLTPFQRRKAALPYQSITRFA